MVSRHTGHFVQVFRDFGPEKYVEVMGRRNTATTTREFWLGWHNVSRELPRRKAVKIAKEYRNAGFNVRVHYYGSPESKVTDEFKKKS